MTKKELEKRVAELEKENKRLRLKNKYYFRFLLMILK